MTTYRHPPLWALLALIAPCVGLAAYSGVAASTVELRWISLASVAALFAIAFAVGRPRATIDDEQVVVYGLLSRTQVPLGDVRRFVLPDGAGCARVELHDGGRLPVSGVRLSPLQRSNADDSHGMPVVRAMNDDLMRRQRATNVGQTVEGSRDNRRT